MTRCRARPGRRAFGHSGAGGSLGFADAEHGVGFGYVMNRMQVGLAEDKRPRNLVRARCTRCSRARHPGPACNPGPTGPVEALRTADHGRCRRFHHVHVCDRRPPGPRDRQARRLRLRLRRRAAADALVAHLRRRRRRRAGARLLDVRRAGTPTSATARSACGSPASPWRA